ncbi:zinc-finger double domain-containing protein [Phthorimaea operculella]|nr:zinc-finger double domain-containing protein [Phthorimaea operculella]
MSLDTIKCEGEEVLACRGCLATGVTLYSIHEKGLAQVFGDFTGFPVVPSDSYPQRLCAMCVTQVNKFLAFGIRCHSAMYTLQQMEMNNCKITTESLANVERAHIKLNLLKSEVKTISFDGSETTETTTENSQREKPLEDEMKTFDNEIKTIEQCMVNEDLTEDDDKPLKHLMSALFGKELNIPKEEDDFSDNNGAIDTHIDSDSDSSMTLKSFTRHSGHKNKRSKTDKNDTTPTKKTKKKKPIKNTANKPKLKTENDKTVKKRTKMKEESQDGDQELLKTIANILRKIWQGNKSSNISDIWELVYKQSLSMTDENLDDVDCSSFKKNASTKHQINKFISLTRKLSQLYNMEVKFLSIEDHRREIEDRRNSDKYVNAPYRCELCCKVYVFEDTYKRHMISHDPSSGDVECEICQYRFKNRKRYMNHFHIYHTKKIICKECGVVNRAWNFAKQHYKWHGGVTTVCDQCGKHFPDKKLYCMHVRAVHRAELATTLCLLCGDTYNGETGLRMHMDKAHRQAARCGDCGAMFRSTEALEAHIANSCVPGGSSCPLCGDNFPSDSVMRDHYDQLHKTTLVCEQCNKLLPTLVLFKKHVKRCLLPRDQERRRRENKEKGSKQIYNLNLMCELCGKGNFKCFSTLRSHQRVHTGERPYSCDICQKGFREMQFLKNHMKTHTDERRYKCPFCPKAFRQMGHRAAHILTHTKERPFACTTCTKRYTGLTALKEHINTAHRGLPPRQRGRHRDKQEL